MKRNYPRQSRPKARIKKLSEKNIAENPFDQFNSWFQTAERSVPQPFSMILATASADGRPSARVVLLKGVDARGFSYFTNYESRKGKDLTENPQAAVLFYWPTLDCQIRIEGSVERLTREESQAYFDSRPRNSRIGAWASRQSETIASRSVLEARFSDFQERYRNGNVPLPEYWGGFRLVPRRFEFWQSRRNRLHDRFSYVKDGTSWRIVRLSP